MNTKVIPGYDNFYCVNSNGEVSAPSYVDKTGHLRKMKKLKQTKRGKGYKCVGLQKEGKQRLVSVHRLVAEAFIPNPLNKSQVNHKDLNKENNSVENLEWVTGSENVVHSFKSGSRKKLDSKGSKNNQAKLDEAQVNQILKESKSATEIAEIYRVSKSTIYKIRRGSRWMHVTRKDLKW